MSSQIVVNEEALRQLISRLQNYLSEMRREWRSVSSGWGSLSMTWHDQQRDKFEPFYRKMESTFADNEAECERYIAFLVQQLSIAETRRGRLGDL